LNPPYAHLAFLRHYDTDTKRGTDILRASQLKDRIEMVLAISKQKDIPVFEVSFRLSVKK
jgi:hypothetical protein